MRIYNICHNISLYLKINGKLPKVFTGALLYYGHSNKRLYVLKHSLPFQHNKNAIYNMCTNPFILFVLDIVVGNILTVHKEYMNC